MRKLLEVICAILFRMLFLIIMLVQFPLAIVLCLNDRDIEPLKDYFGFIYDGIF